MCVCFSRLCSSEDFVITITIIMIVTIILSLVVVVICAREAQVAKHSPDLPDYFTK